MIEIQWSGALFGGRPLPRAVMTRCGRAIAAGAATLTRWTQESGAGSTPIPGRGIDGVAADGRYRLRTVKPGPYPEPSGTMRTPHIHFDVTNADYRLAAQMYFPDEPLNANDLLLRP